MARVSALTLGVTRACVLCLIASRGRCLPKAHFAFRIELLWRKWIALHNSTSDSTLCAWSTPSMRKRQHWTLMQSLNKTTWFPCRRSKKTVLINWVPSKAYYTWFPRMANCCRVKYSVLLSSPEYFCDMTWVLSSRNRWLNHFVLNQWIHR